ncbi:MAG: T9SS type A sorting domain-containing protein [Saprospiraceae bacterium]|nr:T9SS type A sorting domain-containing protein [Saprospiraceae bacterium]
MKFNIQAIVWISALLVCFPGTSLVFGQNGLPGGVAGLQHWYAISGSTEKTMVWEDKKGKSESPLLLTQNQYTYLNGHPVLALAQLLEPLKRSVSSDFLRKSTIVSLYQAQDTFQEQIIWRLAKPGLPGLVLSTHRLGDVDDGRYFNSPSQKVLHPLLHTYVQHQNTKRASVVSEWHIGQAGEMTNLPVTPFTGNLPVLLIYDRVLSKLEQLRVNSHLALQYGISLPSTDYVNAAGKIIWNFKDNQDFPYRITGIAHDPISGLNQKRSSSQMSRQNLLELSAGPWTLTNAANNTELPSGASLIWSDNGERLRFVQEDARTGTPTLLERKWLMDVRGGGEQVTTTLRLHVRNLEKLLKPNEELWLAVDQSGSGNFDYASTKYYAVSKAEGEIFTYDDIPWDLDQLGKDVFSLALGKPMLPVMAIDYPSCHPAQEAKLRLQVYGGKAPYSIQWTAEEKTKPRYWELKAEEELIWTEKTSGFFELRITDANGDRITKTINLQNEDAPPIPLLTQYTLPSSSSIRLSLDQVDLQYSAIRWTNSDGSISQNDALQIQKPGTYRVRIESESGCAREHQFQVLAPVEHFVEDWQLFPNPIGVNEYFELRVSLTEHHPLDISLMDSNGRLISSVRRQSAAFHTYQNRLQTPGMYQIVLRNGKDQMSLPIVVQ